MAGTAEGNVTEMLHIKPVFVRIARPSVENMYTYVHTYVIFSTGIQAILCHYRAGMCDCK